MDVLLERGLPAAIEAEQVVLGAALLGYPFPNISAALIASDFSLEKHRRIFAVMCDLDASGSPIDPITVGNELRGRGKLESVDGPSYLWDLREGLPTLANVDAYVEIVHEKSILRQAIFAHKAAIDELLLAADPVPEMLERAERAIANLSTKTRSTEVFRTPKEVIEQAGGLDAIVNPQRGSSIATPWPNLNRVLQCGGLLPGQITVIGARPSMGKTALACQIADGAASAGIGVAFFTLEMQAEAILLRMVGARAQVDNLKITQNRAKPAEIEALRRAFIDLAEGTNCPLWIDDTTGCTVPAMRAALRRLAARYSIGLVVVDYLQLVETTGASGRNRYEQVSEISRGLKRLARESAVPIVILAQLNRESERNSRKPQLSDLRDSGGIEQDADIVLLPTIVDGQDEKADTLETDLVIAKQRNGPRCAVRLTFLRRYAKFIQPDEKATHID